MIDLRWLRAEPETVIAAMARRGRPELSAALGEVLALDGEVRRAVARRDAIRAEVNELSKRVGAAKRDGDDEAAATAQEASRALGDEERALAERVGELEARIQQHLLEIPNVPHAKVPDGASDADNPIVKGPVGLPAEYPEHQRVPHWEIGSELGILDNERAVKISGAMFTMQRGLGATLSRALCQYALDRNADEFEEIRPPSLVTTATLTSSGQLPKFADDAYSIERDDLWCIPTAEVPLTSVYAGEILDAETLPRKMMAYTPCYRREAGSAGRDTRGMLRAHEFDKVEILAVATAEQAPELLAAMVARIESTIASLGLPYRMVEICTGDLGQSHHRSVDVEVYAPGADAWLEVSSVSWFSDYQARRANIRLRTPGQKGTTHAHTLNGSALAVPRVWAAILENNRQPDGSVTLPEVLHPYLRGATSIPAR